MKIASFNINGIKARIQLLKEWLKKENPDIIGLQELKSDNSNLNKEMFADLAIALHIMDKNHTTDVEFFQNMKSKIHHISSMEFRRILKRGGLVLK